jgi:hypothetical protein
MRDNISTDRLGVVLSEAHTIRVRYNLVRDHHCDAELLREARQLTEELC